MIVTPKPGNSPHTAVPSDPNQGMESARTRAINSLKAKMSENAPRAPEAIALAPSEQHSHASSSESVESGQIDSNESASVAPEAVQAAEPAKAKEDPLSTQYAILARKEKAIRAKVQELKAKEDALKAQELASKDKSEPNQSRSDDFDLKSRLVKDPMSVLNELGITYDQLTNSAAAQPTFEELRLSKLETELKAEIKALRDAQDNTKKSFEERDKQSYDQAISQITNEAKALVMSNPDFETIKETGSLNDVIDLIKQTFESDGILLTVEEAAREVEDHLVEEVMKTIKIKKIQQRLQPAAKASEAEKPQDQAPKSQTMKTLTNAVASTRPLTAKERAILAFRGESK